MTISAPVPPPTGVDLRSMLRKHLARRAMESLDASARRRDDAMRSADTAAAWTRDVTSKARVILGVDTIRNLPLNASVVSRHERCDYVLENVLFESVDGWVVNGSVFLPRLPGMNPPYTPVIVPCGHSTKADACHQLPPQVFARAGYAAITFDPPAQGGEKNQGNDHFHDGPRCYAVGHTSQRYFVADALRAMDYMASRSDVDVSRGFAMTGVSGGGYTTMWSALLDDRIKVAGPVCCLTRQHEHPIGNLYACCAETLPIGKLEAGIDEPDLMAAWAPRPQLYMHGLGDEVFTPEFTRHALEPILAAYRSLGAADRFEVYAEQCGHDYTVTMARRFVEFLAKHLPPREPVRANAADVDPVAESREAMICRPPAEPNMRTISAARAASLRTIRPRLSGRADAARAVRAIVPGIDAARVTRVHRGDCALAFCADVEEMMFEHESDVCLPCTAIWPRASSASQAMKSPAVVIFDDQGRWTPLRRHGWGAAVTGYINRDAKNPPIVLSADLRGWGDTVVAPGPYDLAGWSGLDRWTSYHAASLGDGLLGQRTRDAVAIIRWLLAQEGVDANRLIIAGAGVGGIVALFAAAMFERVAGVVCDATPVSIEAIVAEPAYRWPLDVFHPGVLLHADLPELRDALSPLLSVRTCNADESPATKREQSRGEDAVIVEWIAKRLG